MVNVNDLMVGNWIESPHGIVQVQNILTDSIITKIEGRVGNLYPDICLEPIPVTEEMLKKIGFKEDFALVRFYRYWDKDYKYKLDVDEGYTNSGKKWSIHIDNGDCATIGSGEFTYVYELQNLVRINCKADLPITKDMIEDV